MLFRLGQHSRRVDVLPSSVSNIDGVGVAVRRHRSHSVGKTAILVAFYSFEVIENVRGTDKETDIDRIVNR